MKEITGKSLLAIFCMLLTHVAAADSKEKPSALKNTAQKNHSSTLKSEASKADVVKNIGKTQKTASTQTSPGDADECEDSRILAYNIYEMRNKKGQIEEKHSVFAVTDWSSHSSYQGLLVLKKDAADSIRVDFHRTLTGPSVKNASFDLGPWSRDSQYHVAKNFSPEDFLNNESGILYIRLLKKADILCERMYEAAHEGD